MTLKINPIVATALIAGILILLFALWRGCKQNKGLVAANTELNVSNKQLLSTIDSSRKWNDSSKKEFEDSLDFERGQKELIIAQKERTEDELDAMSRQVKDLLQKHKFAQYADTSAVTVPAEYLSDCENCFTKLEDQNNLVNRYKNDINKLQDNWDKQNQLYQKRFKELDQEKIGFYNKVQSLAQSQQKELDKLKPHGRLYLSWGVIFRPVPVAAGAGFLYQNKYNLIYGCRWYYGKDGHMIEASLNFPLSIKIK